MTEEMIMPEVNEIDYGKLNEKSAEMMGYVNYLTDTDWLAQREADGGEKMPAEVWRLRAEARVHISKLRSDMAVIEEGGEPAMSELQYARELKMVEIEAYDKTDAVNSFSLQGKQIWLPKETRVGLVNSISIERAAKKSTTNLWFEGVEYSLPIDIALQMLSALELYALDCYNVTQQHLSAVSKLTTVEEVEKYDYKTGYPEKLNL